MLLFLPVLAPFIALSNDIVILSDAAYFLSFKPFQRVPFLVLDEFQEADSSQGTSTRFIWMVVPFANEVDMRSFASTTVDLQG